MNHLMLRERVLLLFLIMGICLSSLWAADSEKKVIFKQGLPYLQLPNNRFIPLLPLNIIKERRPLTGAEILKVNSFKAKIRTSMKSIPSSYSLAQFQTPIKDQDGRGTCWVFPIVGGVEAFYKRNYGISLDLSEQYVNHTLKSTVINYPKIFKYENQSSYWGGGNSHEVAGLMNYYIPLEAEVPYKTQAEMDQIRNRIPEAGLLDWKESPVENMVTQEQVDAFEYSPKYIPLKSRWHAVYGVKDFLLLSENNTRDLDFMERLIAAKHEVITDFYLKWKEVNGIYEYDSNAVGAGHCMLVIGYDRDKKYFLVKNSGGDSYFKVSYNFMKNASTGGAIIEEVVNPKDSPDIRAYWIGKWNMEHDGWKGKLIIRRIAGKDGRKEFRLGSYYAADGSVHTVNGYFMENRNGLGLAFFINFDKEETTPGDQTGQRFEIYVYSFEPKFAGGDTTWNNNPFGVFLSREEYLSIPASGHFNVQKWVGTWSMNHDGWKGKLYIKSLEPANTSLNISGNYVGADGKNYFLFGTINKKTTHIADLKIFFPNNTQSFRLIYHTLVDSFFSGYTIWNGLKFGLHGVKSK